MAKKEAAGIPDLNNIKITIVNDENSCIKAVQHLISLNPKIVGFDCEWNSTTNVCLECSKEYDRIRSKVSLIQIAHPQIIVLIRIHLLHSIPEILKSFLFNNKIFKVGVGIFDDVSKLKRCYKLRILGCIELNEIILSKLPYTLIKSLFYPNKSLTKSNTYYKDKHHRSLKDLCHKILNKHMTYKNLKFSRNWQQEKLSTEQILYSAEDAWIGYEIFMKLTGILIKNKSNDAQNVMCMDNDDYFVMYHEIVDLNIKRRGGKKHKNEFSRKMEIKQSTDIMELTKNQNKMKHGFSLHCIKFKENIRNMDDFIQKHHLLPVINDDQEYLEIQNKMMLLQSQYSQLLTDLHQKQLKIIENFVENNESNLSECPESNDGCLRILDYMISVFEKDRTLMTHD